MYRKSLAIKHEKDKKAKEIKKSQTMAEKSICSFRPQTNSDSFMGASIVRIYLTILDFKEKFQHFIWHILKQ